MQPHLKILRKISSMCWLPQDRDRLHKCICCSHIRPSVSQRWCPWVCLIWDEWRFSSMLEWILIMHIIVRCFWLKSHCLYVWELWRVPYFPARQCSCSQARKTINLLEWETPAFISPYLWPSSSTVMNQVDVRNMGKNGAASLPNSSFVTANRTETETTVFCYLQASSSPRCFRSKTAWCLFVFIFS